MGTFIEVLKQQGPSLCIDYLAAVWGDQIAESDYLTATAESKSLLCELREAIKAGELLVYSRKRERLYRASDSSDLERNLVRMKPETFNAWLKSQGLPQLGLPPSTESDSHESLDVLPQSQGNASSPSGSAPDVATKRPPPRKLIDGEIRRYIVEMWRNGRYSKVKDLYRALMSAEGTEASPFVKKAGELTLRKTGKPIALKTLQNAGKSLREEAGLS